MPALERTLTIAGFISNAASDLAAAPVASAAIPEDALEVGETSADKRTPCFRAPKSLYDGRRFPYPRKGEAPLRQPPRGFAGSEPATP